MIVFRVEHRKNSLGPYHHGILPFRESKRHPKFSGIMPAEDCLYGFKSTADLRRWFNLGERKKLFNNNYVVSMYSVPEDSIFQNETQLIFKRDASRKIAWESLNYF